LYYYKFEALEASSLVGITKTAPKNSDNIRFAVVSCSNYEFGPFNAYGNIAKDKSIEAVIHLGDYIYEYGKGVYGDSSTGRFHLPENEIISLHDYRTRYSQYRLDPDLRAAHAQHPFITIWDDHEIANNSYNSGAQNHQQEEGSYEERKNAAVQTYHEWMPVRQVNPLYRKFSYGNLVDLIMLDERLEGRTAPPDSVDAPGINEASQRMLGEEQLDWLKGQLSNSKANWKVIGNQVIFSYLNWGYKTFNINLDSWDGYPYERSELAELILRDSLKNIIFITGDTHSSWAFEVTHNPFNNYNQATGEGAYAVEFGVTSVNSGNANERYPTDSVEAHEKTIVNTALNPHLKYANLRDHGYLVLSFTDSLALAKWHFVKHMDVRSSEEKEGQSVSVKAGNNNILGL
jgi:alkaline phosphatase D